jgi:uncharacterized phage-like protein YoqJ
MRGSTTVPSTASAGQPGRWPLEAHRVHARLLRVAAEVHVVCPGPYQPWKFERRNEWMVDRADRLVALWSGAHGGTARCVAYAERTGNPVENLWARWLQATPT